MGESVKLRGRSVSQLGFGMLEVGLALVVVAFAAAGLSKMLTSNVAATKAKSNAERLAMVTLAADQYLIQNEQQLKTVLPAGGAPIAIPVGKTCATCSVPSGPSGLPSVQGDGLLSTAYVDLNNNQQSHALIVKELSSGDLDAIVTTYGGSPIDDENLGYITGLIGAAAGGVYTNAAIAPTNQISGAHGGWGDATSSWNASIGGTNVRPSSGHVQVSLSLAQASGMGAIDPDDVLFRTSNGNATRNTMATDLLLGANDIWGGSTIEGRSFRDRDNGWLSDPSGTSQLQNLTVRGDTNMGSGAATIRLLPNNAVANSYILVGNTASNQTSIRGDGRVFVDNYLQVGDTSGNTSRLYNNGNIRADQVAYAQVFADATTGETSYFVDPGKESQFRELRIGQAGVLGNDVIINKNDLANVHADGEIIGESAVKSPNGVVRSGGDGPTDSRSTMHPDGIIQASQAMRTPNFVSGMTIEAITSPVNGMIYAAGFYDINGRDLGGVQNFPYRINPSATDTRLRKLTVGEFGNPTAEIQIDGDIVTPGNVTAAAYYYTSDERLKEDVAELDGWSVLAGLEPKSYRYKNSGRKGMGLIAQDVEKLLPDLVLDGEDGMKSVNYLDLIGPLIDEVQDLHEENERQRQDIDVLKAALAEQ